MTLKGNRLTPSDGMYLQRISDGSVADGEMWIPPSLRDDFREITRDEYLKLTQQTDTDTADDITKRVSKLEEQHNNTATKLTTLEEGLNLIKGLIASLGQIKGD